MVPVTVWGKTGAAHASASSAIPARTKAKRIGRPPDPVGTAVDAEAVVAPAPRDVNDTAGALTKEYVQVSSRAPGKFFIHMTSGLSRRLMPDYSYRDMRGIVSRADSTAHLPRELDETRLESRGAPPAPRSARSGDRSHPEQHLRDHRHRAANGIGPGPRREFLSGIQPGPRRGQLARRRFPQGPRRLRRISDGTGGRRENPDDARANGFGPDGGNWARNVASGQLSCALPGGENARRGSV